MVSLLYPLSTIRFRFVFMRPRSHGSPLQSPADARDDVEVRGELKNEKESKDVHSRQNLDNLLK